MKVFIYIYMGSSKGGTAVAIELALRSSKQKGL